MTTATNRVHPFEQAGLGIAPFKLVGTFVSKYQAIPGDPNCPIQPGSSCDYCAQGIMLVCVIRGADGRDFKVGYDCAAKTTRDAATTADQKLAAAIDGARRKLNRKKAHVRAADKAAELAMLLDSEFARVRLASLPHPNKWRASEGDTLLQWAMWMLNKAGAAGQARALKAVKAAL